MATKIHPQPAWDTAYNPDVLLNLVWPRPRAYQAETALRSLPPPLVRRLRLYGAACARMVWDVLPPDARNAVLLSERAADDPAAEAGLRAAAVRMRYGPITFQHQAANAAGWASAGQFAAPSRAAGPPRPVWNPVEAARETAKALATRAAGPAPAGGSPVSKAWQVAWNRAFSAAREHQAELVRDIFPPPQYARSFSPEWRTDTVTALARQMDGSGDFSAVPILADALQDAGCTDEVMLGRCRAPSGVHGRGNWVVDSVLGRE
ncbi:hypothetical protein R5W24_001088 [Gemmata sp. JC717]|uniref:hypothetical protein n=1 Tax=Gemmata algarum TaxID=2975278 RepID=UPI0021BB6809|nr:hypothetical protein [Gemmata algarum]MDY3552008.1 hypothetical protein [Gemmata algarum]